MAFYPCVGDGAGVDGLPFVVRASLSLPNAHGISRSSSRSLSRSGTVLCAMLSANTILRGARCSFQLDEPRAEAGNLRLPPLIVKGRYPQDMTF